MRIGVDASSLIQKKSGIGSFADSIITALQKEVPQDRFVLYKPDNQKDLNTPRRIAWEAFDLPRRVERDKISVLYSPGFSPPPFGRFKKIVTVHDVIGLIYPKNVRPAARFYWSHWLPWSIRRADLCVASSESTRRDLEKYMKIPKGTVEVVPLAADPIYQKKEDSFLKQTLLKKYGLKESFLITVGTLEPRKNHLRLLEAFATINTEFSEVSLMIVGKNGGVEVALKDFIKEKNLANQVKIAGYVPAEDLLGLYNAAMGYVMISLYEGFGLPALEAMSCGLTGVVSDASSLPEIVGDTAWMVNPINVEEIAAAIKTLIIDQNKRKLLAESAMVRASEFSYKKTAKSMLEIFKRALR